MKRGRFLALATVLCLLTGTIVLAQMQEDAQKHPACNYCGIIQKPSSMQRRPSGSSVETRWAS